MAEYYTMRQARMDLGGRIVTNLEEEDIDVLFEDFSPEEPPYRIVESGPEGHKIKHVVYEEDPFFNKGNRKRMETARRELVSLIRKWMQEAKESPV